MFDKNFEIFIGLVILILSIIAGYVTGFNAGIDTGEHDLSNIGAYMKGLYDGRNTTYAPPTPCYLAENPMNASNWTTYKR